MQSTDLLLKNNFAPADRSTSISTALELMNNHTLTHIPVVEQGQLLGIISYENVAFAQGDTFADIMYDASCFFATATAHWQQIIEIFGKYDTNIVPVVNQDGTYVGYYILANFIHLFTQTPFLTEIGSFLVVEKDIESFSFSEVAQIVESNQGKMLGAFVSEIEKNRIQITLKISLTSISNLLQTFRRYGYNILMEKEDDLYLKDLKDNSEYFNKYLSL